MSAFLGQPDRPNHQVVKGCGSERDNETGTQQLEFAAEPPRTALRLASIGLRMDAPLAALFELEMLDRIGDITNRAVDASFVQTFIK